MNLKKFYDRLEELVKDAKAELANETEAEEPAAFYFENPQSEERAKVQNISRILAIKWRLPTFCFSANSGIAKTKRYRANL